jgi:putative hemolysin
MELLEKKDVAGIINRKDKPDIMAVKILMNFLKVNEINEIYSRLFNTDSVVFLSEALKEFGIHYEFCDTDLKNIPKEGGFITISNHPYGGIDGLLLLHILLSQRPDFKIMGNFLIQRIKPIEEHIFPVNPFELHPEYASSVPGIRQAFLHVQNGYGLGIFPAGEVSSYNRSYHKISDKKWNTSILKFIKRSNVPVIPVYFSGTNSRMFHTLGLLHPSLRTVKLPSELFNKKDKPVGIKIGKPISVEEQSTFSDIEQYGRYLRARTYLPEASSQIKKFFAQPNFRVKKEQPLVEPADVGLILNEIQNLKPQCKLFSVGNFVVYYAQTCDIPNCMHEIGRLREKTFREVGEGTNNKIDIDEYDIYYRQLFLWDNEKHCIAGAYRIGLGKDIMREYGIRGFYTHSLFKYKRRFYPLLENALELGRSFVTLEYQKKPLSLFLLWKGILFFLLSNPEYRYLIGPVSISNEYSSVSRRLLMDFILAHYSEPQLAQYIKPRNKLKVSKKQLDTSILLENMNGNLKQLDRALNEIESRDTHMPILLKKYLQINGRILAFNLDPKFNDALDGLLLLDVFNIPENIIASLSKEIKEI